ncbi:hypothetical protein GF325_03925 [Candidatus Bathyarchaeota archaeon]|nr:hypothetical protein [Candidatus Bathyarchaeota archaeon]
MDSLEILGEMPKPHDEIHQAEDPELQRELSSILMELMWNDPVEGQADPFVPSFRGPGIYTFNRSVVEDFLEDNHALRMIRAHESSRGGFSSIFNGKLLHVFSTEPYFGTVPQAFILRELGDGTISACDLDGKKRMDISP